MIDQFERRFAEGAPSLVECETLKVDGDVRFGPKVKIVGNVTIKNTGEKQIFIPEGSVVRGTWSF
jgi:UTP--glucose-1-phosphate uridylyltransferase